MTENISNLIVAAFSLIGAIMASILIGLAIWTFRDIRSRSRDILVQILATVVVAVIPIGGIIVYLLLRPRETLSEKYVRALEEESLLSSIEDQEFCPTCGRRVDANMRFCPSCHTKLRNQCAKCGNAIHLSWDMCPYCGTAQTPEMPAAQISVSRPQPARVAAPPRPQVMAPKPAAKAINQPARGGFSLTGVLDKVGGAVEGAVSKVQSRGQDVAEDVEEAAAPVMPPPPRVSAMPRQKPSAPPQSAEELE